MHYRCHTGHAFGAEALSTLIDDNLRRTLASALRAMEERLALMHRLEQQAKGNGYPLLREDWAARAREVQKELSVLRSGIARLEGLAAAPPAAAE